MMFFLIVFHAARLWRCGLDRSAALSHRHFNGRSLVISSSFRLAQAMKWK